MVAGLSLDFVLPGLECEYTSLGFFELTAAVGVPLRAPTMVTGLTFDFILPGLKGKDTSLVGFELTTAVGVGGRAAAMVAGLSRQVLATESNGEGAGSEGSKNGYDESKLHGG